MVLLYRKEAIEYRYRTRWGTLQRQTLPSLVASTAICALVLALLVALFRWLNG